MCWLCVGQGMLIRARGGFGSTTHRIPPPVAQQERDLAIEARGVGEGRPRESQMASLGALVATRRCCCCYDVIIWDCGQFCCGSRHHTLVGDQADILIVYERGPDTVV